MRVCVYVLEELEGVNMKNMILAKDYLLHVFASFLEDRMNTQ